MMQSGQEQRPPLTPAVFHILLALARRDRHGYEIMKQVAKDSLGKVTLGPGTLYGSIKRMLGDGLVEEAGERPAAEIDDERRRYYRITSTGRQRLVGELERYEEAVAIARRRDVLPRRALVPSPPDAS
jgi:DNA-binding PadR family transcriptional regulator